MEKSLITWSILEYREKNHSNDWYWTVGLVTLIIVGFSFYQKNYLFGFLILISIGTLTYLTMRKPELLDVQVLEDGIKIKNEFFLYRRLKGFWVEDKHEHENEQHLLLLTDRFYSPMIAIPIGDVAPELLRSTLEPHIEETEMHENPSHKFLDILGF